MIRITRQLALASVLVTSVLFSLGAASVAAAAHHEPVLQVVAVRVNPGMLEKYRKEVKKLQAILERVGSGATMRMWHNVQGGPDTGTILVGLEFPNAAAWAADTPKMQADKEWQDTLGGLDKLRKVEGSSIWRDISTNATAAGQGSVLVITGVAVNPGRLAEYRERLKRMPAISKRLGLTAGLRMWHATMAGPNTGAVAVGAEYKDLATYVKEDAKLSADAEWQGILRGLGDIRTLRSRSLYQEITP